MESAKKAIKTATGAIKPRKIQIANWKSRDVSRVKLNAANAADGKIPAGVSVNVIERLPELANDELNGHGRGHGLRHRPAGAPGFGGGNRRELLADAGGNN